MNKLSNNNNIIKLKISIVSGDRKVSELVFCEPKLKNLLDMDNVTGELAKLLAFISSLTGEPVKILKELSLKSGDYQTVQQYCVDILGKHQVQKMQEK